MKKFTLLFCWLIILVPGLKSQTNDLVVINENVKDIDLLRYSVVRDAEFLIVNDQADIFKDIAEQLDLKPEIKKVHMLIPCSEGEMSVNGVLYDHHTISDVSGLDLLKDSGIMLLLYGSNLAEVAEGRLLIDKMAAMTNLLVAGSTTTTAGKNAGGDWVLEYLSDETVVLEPVFDEEALKNYQYNF